MNKCKNCRNYIENQPNERKEYCGTICEQSYKKAKTREKWHKFYNSMSYYDKIILDEILQEENESNL